MGITEELKVAVYGTIPNCDDIAVGAGEGRQETEIIGGAEKGYTEIPEEVIRKDTRDMPNIGEGLGQEKEEEAAEETIGEEAEVDRGVGPGKEAWLGLAALIGGGDSPQYPSDFYGFAYPGIEDYKSTDRCWLN